MRLPEEVFENYGVEIMAETFDKDFDEVGWEPRKVEDEEDYGNDEFGFNN